MVVLPIETKHKLDSDLTYCFKNSELSQDNPGLLSGDFVLDMACLEIYRQYGDVVSVVDKSKYLRKFGRNANVGTSLATIMQFTGTEISETYVFDNLINKLVCDKSGFTGTVYVESHELNLSTGKYTFHIDQVTLNGQTPVDLPHPGARISRIAPKEGSFGTLGTGFKIYAYEGTSTVTNGVPEDDTKVHCLLDGDFGRSEKCATTVEDNLYFICLGFAAGVLKKTSASADIRFEKRRCGLSGGTDQFQTIDQLSVGTGSNQFETANFGGKGYEIITPNSDLRLSALASTTGVEVVGKFFGFFAQVQN